MDGFFGALVGLLLNAFFWGVWVFAVGLTIYLLLALFDMFTGSAAAGAWAKFVRSTFPSKEGGNVQDQHGNPQYVDERPNAN